MQIIIDDKIIHLDLPRNDIVMKQVVDEVESYLLSEKQVPVSLAVDGVSFTQSDLEEAYQRILNGNETLEFGIVKLQDYMVDQLSGVAIAHETLINQMAELISDMKKGIMDQVEAISAEFHHFFEFWTYFYQMFPEECQDLAFGEKNFEGWLNNLVDKLKEVVLQLEAKDFLQAADILERELVPDLILAKPIIPAIQARFLVNH